MSFLLKFLLLFIPFSVLSFIANSQSFTSSKLPIVIINTNGMTIVDNPKIDANMGIIWNGDGKANRLSDQTNNYDGKVGIEIRGSSSQMFPKKSYGFETRSSDGASADVSLLGLPHENDWILYAPYTDKTMIRDVLTYTLDASLGHWSPRCRFVELFLNNQYQGVYVLMEKIKRNKKRVNIAKLSATDISGENLTGGYIIKIDKTTGGIFDGWDSDYPNIIGRTYYQYDYPKPLEINGEQKAYIKTWVQNMEKSLYLGKYTGAGNYHEYLNDSSFIDFMIINELAKNVDGYRLSSYLYKGKNKLLNCGPIWDFNLGYGNADYYNGWLTSGFQYEEYLGSDNWQIPFWWTKLLGDQAYVTKLKNRWTLLRKKELSNDRISFVTDSLVGLLTDAQFRNYVKWPILGNYIWPNYYVGYTYNSEVYWMKDWINNRLSYLDKMWSNEINNAVDSLIPHAYGVFPNPFSDKLTIQVASVYNGAAKAEFFSLNGPLISEYNVVIVAGKIELSFSGMKPLNPGLYVIRIIWNDVAILKAKVAKSI